MSKRYTQVPAMFTLNDCRIVLREQIGEPLRVLIISDAQVLATLTDAQLATLVPHPQLRLLALDDHHSVAFIPSLVSAAVLNAPAVALLQRLPMQQAQAASEIGALTALARLGLLTPSLAPPVPPDHAPLLAWLQVTSDCNLSCRYCYISRNTARMRVETAFQSVDALIRTAQSYGYSQIALKYAGGEPLLALDLVEQVHRYACERAAFAGIDLQASLLTNGVLLTKTTVAHLRTLQVSLTISLDGLDNAHDAQRPTRAGGPSATQVRAGLMCALEGGMHPTVTVVASVESLPVLPELADWLLAHQIPFTMSFPRERYAGPVAVETCNQLIAGMREVYATVARHPPPWSVLGALLDQADLSHPHSRACPAGQHYIVISPDGRLRSCQMLHDQPHGSISSPDPLQLVREGPERAIFPTVDVRPICHTCEWRSWCSGGCPVASYQATGRIDQPSPYCAVYTALYPDLLQLEGRRLLYWYSH
ncbi:MAG: SPASM domain-containing protein [Oscillochloris sp.]|nr:SPASM domain-containing protein [Oscillochloris sp.]